MMGSGARPAFGAGSALSLFIAQALMGGVSGGCVRPTLLGYPLVWGPHK